jgi:hypothetical protein
VQEAQVSIKYEIPERCLLAQAAINVIRGDDPIPDEIYLASPAQSVGWSDELIWALRAGRLHARGNLFNAMYIKEECRWAQCFLEEEDAEINSAFWSRDQIDLQKSSLRVNRDAVEAKYKVAPFAASFENDDESGPAETCYIFSDITIATKDLFEHFPGSAAQVTKELTPTRPSVETAESGKPRNSTPRPRKRRLRDAAKEVIDALYPGGVPTGLKDNQLYKAVMKRSGLAMSIETVLRAAGRRQ